MSDTLSNMVAAAQGSAPTVAPHLPSFFAPLPAAPVGELTGVVTALWAAPSPPPPSRPALLDPPPLVSDPALIGRRTPSLRRLAQLGLAGDDSRIAPLSLWSPPLSEETVGAPDQVGSAMTDRESTPQPAAQESVMDIKYPNPVEVTTPPVGQASPVDPASERIAEAGHAAPEVTSDLEATVQPIRSESVETTVPPARQPIRHAPAADSIAGSIEASPTQAQPATGPGDSVETTRPDSTAIDKDLAHESPSYVTPAVSSRDQFMGAQLVQAKRSAVDTFEPISPAPDHAPGQRTSSRKAPVQEDDFPLAEHGVSPTLPASQQAPPASGTLPEPELSDPAGTEHELLSGETIQSTGQRADDYSPFRSEPVDGDDVPVEPAASRLAPAETMVEQSPSWQPAPPVAKKDVDLPGASRPVKDSQSIEVGPEPVLPGKVFEGNLEAARTGAKTVALTTVQESGSDQDPTTQIAPAVSPAAQTHPSQVDRETKSTEPPHATTPVARPLARQIQPYEKQRAASILAASKSLPTSESQPAGEPLPTSESLPAGESLSAVDPLPAGESLPVGESLPAGDPLPASESLPTNSQLVAAGDLAVDRPAATPEIYPALQDRFGPESMPPAPASPSRPTIEISIGRIEVRVRQDGAPQARPVARPKPTLSLDDYLSRQGGDR